MEMITVGLILANIVLWGFYLVLRLVDDPVIALLVMLIVALIV